jgi:hypothetical protein
MLLREFLNRTGEGKAAVVGWGRGMGHKGHMYLASSVITQANEAGADPYFVVSRTVGKDDPITPEEKMQIYKRVFPKHGHIFHTATDEMPDLTRVLTQLDKHGYTDVTVVVGADQVKALSYVKQYNGVPNKAGETPYSFNSLNVISRQETNDPSKEEEGPRATPMRAVLTDPDATDEQKFQTWRNAMSPEISDAEVHELMNKAHERMQSFNKPKAKAKKEKVADEGVMDLLAKTKKDVKKKVASAEEMRKYFEKEKAAEPPKYKDPGDEENVRAVHTRHAYEGSVKYANKVIREMKANEFIKENMSGAGYKAKGKMQPIPKEFKASMQNATTMPALNQAHGSAYTGYRFAIALAGAPDFPTKMEADSWLAGDPLLSTYTQEEYDMVKAAALQVGAGTIENWSGKRSEEMADVNKLSTVAKPKKNKYGI